MPHSKATLIPSYRLSAPERGRNDIVSADRFCLPAEASIGRGSRLREPSPWLLQHFVVKVDGKFPKSVNAMSEKTVSDYDSASCLLCPATGSLRLLCVLASKAPIVGTLVSG